MEDIQYHQPDIPIRIDRVGIRKLKLPVGIADGGRNLQRTVAEIDLGADLPSTLKGTHMSRFIAALDEWDGMLDAQSLCHLLRNIQNRLSARCVRGRFAFPYFIRKTAPVSGCAGTVSHECVLACMLDIDQFSFQLEINVPVMTVCPCSKAISDEGAHSQRTVIRMVLDLDQWECLDHLIGIAESSGSSVIHTLLKREDEKFVTEYAFAHPAFVEDVVRNVASRLKQLPMVKHFVVEAESMESIHNHNAYARIESNGPCGSVDKIAG